MITDDPNDMEVKLTQYAKDATCSPLQRVNILATGIDIRELVPYLFG